ncbi:hypothetical protein [Natronosporangium hydrolyticum]|uniref:hypothetical protein n=1 Tax=Natronosporangium hydrolyticum TaxID=2811111 RepID=UPI001EFA1ADD|nr:hypothetical protein [Natronosporangium hydrolyticum]
MKRLLWLGVGLAIGALVVRAVSKRAQAYTPRGMAAAARDSGANLVDSLRDFVDDVRDGMHEREQELQTAFAEGFVFEDELDDAYADELTDEFDEVRADPAKAGAPDPAGQRGHRTPPEDTDR